MAIGGKQGGNYGASANTFDPVVLADSFDTWRIRTNKMLDTFVANTVTTSNTYLSNGQINSITHGSFKLIGDIVASNVYINDGKLKGGERGNEDSLTIGSNAIFEHAVTISNNVTIGKTAGSSNGVNELLSYAKITAGANAAFRSIVRMDANVYIGTSNLDILQVNAVSTFDGVSTFNANTFFNANVSITENLSVTKEVNVTGNASVGGTFDVTGATTLDGAVTLGNATGDDLTFTGRAASSLVPKTDGVYNLGTTALRWEEVFADTVTAGNAALSGTLGVDGAVDLNTTLNVDGSSTLNGLTVTTLTANSAVDLNSTLNVDGSSTLNGLSVTTLTANGDLTVDTDTLYVDSSNDKVGINTSSPSTALHVKTNSVGTTLFLETAIGLGLASLYFGDSTDADKGAIKYDMNAADMTFRTNATDQMYILSDGKVGIGVDNPSTLLDVDGTFKANADVTLGSVETDKLLVPAHTQITSNLSVSGASVLSGNVQIGTAGADEIKILGQIESTIAPKTDGAHSLGYSAKRWENVYADRFVGGNTELTGVLTITGAGGDSELRGTVVLGTVNTDTVVVGATTRLGPYKERSTLTTTTSSTLALSLRNGMNHVVTLANNITDFSFTHAPVETGTVTEIMGATLVLIQGTGGNKGISWPAAYKFQGGIEPTLSTTEGDIDVLTFFSYDAGSTWLGTTVGLDFS